MTDTPRIGARVGSVARSRAASDLGSNLAVTAGAGAGKTTVLVSRFVEIARDPALGPERVLAITFTRKAAVEMKERAIREFEKGGEVELRRRTEAAYISTIHGFAERVLRERPFDAHIDPSFTVLNDSDKAFMLQEALRKMVERDELHAHARRIGKDLRGGWRIFSLVEEVSRLLREGPESAMREALLMGDDDAAIANALERARAHVGVRETEALDLLGRLRPMLEGMPFRPTAGSSIREHGVFLGAVVEALENRSVQATSPDAWRSSGFTRVIRGPSEIRELVQGSKALALQVAGIDWQQQEDYERELLPLKRAIYGSAKAIGEYFTEQKRSRGVLDFHDLQERAALLLRDHPHVRDEYAERFRHILLDESQDTDALQYGLIQSLRNDGNRLFMVGDPKQAIYEFRGADPDVFREAITLLPEGDRLELPENFRSRAEIVSFVNGVGPALLPESFAQIHGLADYGGLALGTPAVTAIWSIQRMIDDPETGKSKKEPVSIARVREAAAVAEEVARLLVEQPLVRDPDSREVSWVPLRPRHIAMLYRTRTAIPYMERALAERGIPYVTASGRGFFDRAEVLDCIMLLRLLAQPLDDMAAAAVLRSPLIGVSDSDLWRLTRRARESHDKVPPIWSSLAKDEPLSGVFHALQALRRRVRGLPAWEALDIALAEFGYEAALASHTDGPAMLGNLAKLRRRLRELGSLSVHEATRELDTARDLLTDEPLATMVGTADDVVVISTIHQAKGLEWPVVCLPDLQSGSRNRAGAFSARHGALIFKVRDPVAEKEVHTLSSTAVVEELRLRTEAEERRLLYVALTRAREQLLLSACASEAELAPKDDEKFGSSLKFLLRTTDGELGAEGDHDCGSYTTRVHHVTSDEIACTRYRGGESLVERVGEAEFQPRTGGVSELDPQPLPHQPPVSIKVTELLAYERCPQIHRFAHALEIPEHAPRRARVRAGGASGGQLSPVELGTHVHHLLERARFDAPDEGVEIASLLENEPEERRPQLERMLHAVLSGDIGTQAREAERIEREWQFAFRAGGVLIEGVIDLALKAPDGSWTIVDYKSNDITRAGRVEYLVDYYRPQLELYALALSRAGYPVSRCALVFLNGPETRYWSLQAPGAREAWMERTVHAISTESYATTAGPKCERCGYRRRKVCAIGVEWQGAVEPGLAGDAASGTAPAH